jgi:putative ABC transport system permease protein
MLPNGTTTLRYKEKLFNENNAFYADENFLDVFTIRVTKGDAKKGLLEPYSVMMTEDMATKYFGDQNPINKTILLDNTKHEFKVTGIFKPFPANSHMHPEILMSFNTLKDSIIYGEKQLITNFGNNSFFTFLLFENGYDVNRIESQLPNFLDSYVHFPVMPGMPANFKTHQGTKLDLQKLTDIHLHSNLADEIESNGNIVRVYIFSAIALFILLIACINYMNLSTARSALRAKEIGIRKVIGAQRKEIIIQFLSESVLITWAALILAFGLTCVLLPLVNNLSGLSLSITTLLQWNILLPILALPFVIGLISGIYPALFMSSFVPVKVLKGLLKVGSGNISFRQVLVVLQFSISIILIVATTVVYQQLQYIQTKDMGFKKDHILTLQYVSTLHKNYESFRNDLLKNADIKAVGRSSRIPSGRLLDDQNASVMEAGTLQAIKVDLKQLATDYDFIPTFGMQMAAGRSFSRAFTTDTNNYIINEAAVRELGWKTPQNAIDKQIKYGNVLGKVIGVVKDFHFEDLHHQIIPIIMVLPPHNANYFGKLSIKVDGNDSKAAIKTIEGIWHKYIPETPFDYTFLDDRFAKLYKSEEQQGTLFTIFSFIAIFIACLGLFGLSAFTITQRVKEIGIRKILGASILQIVGELSKNFLKLVLMAAVVGLPLAWLLMNKWLLDFAFRISISWWILAVAAIVALIIAFATISFQSIKAALSNPVKSLRCE